MHLLLSSLMMSLCTALPCPLHLAKRIGLEIEDEAASCICTKLHEIPVHRNNGQ
jgi:hypothetical protein